MSDAQRCPCGSGRSLADCCGPYLEGRAHAPTAEALMRSRYAAHVLANLPYIVATHDARTRATLDTIAIEKWAKQSEWRGLVVHQAIAGGPSDAHGTVEFTATYHAMGRTVAHHERSTFEQVDGRWYYVAGETPKSAPVRAAAKPGRNDPCACGSGKKYKKCCG